MIDLDRLASLVDALGEPARTVVRLRHGLTPEGVEYSGADVGRILRFTGERVRQVEGKALRLLALAIGQPDLADDTLRDHLQAAAIRSRAKHQPSTKPATPLDETARKLAEQLRALDKMQRESAQCPNYFIG